MNIVLATHDSVYGRFVAATLHEKVGLDRIVIEGRRASWQFYVRKLWRVGPVNFVFQALLSRWFLREGARALPSLPLPPHERIDSINRCDFGADDVVIGFGTSYVTQRTLARVPQRFLNLHTGILPQYRGVKSEFWTLYEGDHARAGWTVHIMTPSLDGGDIVLQQRVTWHGENPAALRCKLLEDAVPALALLVAQIREHGMAAIPRTPQTGGRYYTTPSWREWRNFRRKRTATPRRVSPTSKESDAVRSSL